MKKLKISPKIITTGFGLTERLLEMLDELVSDGHFGLSRSEVVRRLIQEAYYEQFKNRENETD